VEAQGFRSLPWFPDIYGSGAAERENGLPAWQRRRTLTARFERMAAILARGEGPIATLAGLGPVFTIVDVTQPLFAFALRRAGLPFAYVHTSLPQTRDGAVPPLRSARPYLPGSEGQRRANRDWTRFMVKRALSAAVAAPLGICPSYALVPYYAHRFGVALSELSLDTVYMPQLRSVPELVLCAAAFDYPRPESDQRYEVESIDLARREVAFDLSALPADRPLVYASLGSQLYAKQRGGAFLLRLMQAFAARPDLQLLVSLGKHLRRDELGELPPNVLAVQTAPQLAVLRRARAMVTHGGLGSLKECMYYGLPVLVCPLDVDQPGNAARVAHHGVGMRADIADTSDAHLLWMIDFLLRDAATGRATERMQAAVRAVEDAERGVSLVADWTRRAHPELARERVPAGSLAPATPEPEHR